MHVDSGGGVWRREAEETERRRGRMKLEQESKSGMSDGGGGESGCWGGEGRGPSVAPPVDLRVRVVAPVAVAGVEVAEATWVSEEARVKALSHLDFLLFSVTHHNIVLGRATVSLPHKPGHPVHLFFVG